MPVNCGLVLFYLFSLSSFRGIWIPRWSLNAGFDHILKDVVDAQLDHCFIQIYAVGEAYYPSKYAPYKYLFPAQQLRLFIQNAHARNIKVHAWFNLFFIASYATWPSDPSHPINSKPSWFVWEGSGRSILSFTPDEIARAGLEGYYIAPANYWVRQYIKSIILEVVRDYDFDGVHLDYVRYPSKEFAYDPATRTKFTRIIYVDPVAIVNNYSDLVARFGSAGYNDLYRRWFRFLCEDLSSFIGELNFEIKRLKPSIYLSAAVKVDPAKAREEYYQDWATWINRGYTDFVCLMAYTKDLKSALNRVIREVIFRDRVMVGLGLYIQSPEELRQQINLLRDYDFGGLMFFSYEEIRKNRNFLTVIR